MRHTEFELDRLLMPIERAGFLREYWEKQPLLVARENSGHYAGLFSTADVDSVIAFTRPKFVGPDVGRQDKPKSYVDGWPADGEPFPTVNYPGIAELRGAFGNGKTLVVRGMQHRWHPIAALCRNLEAVFHCPVHANLYLTPEGAQGFDAHFDTHEVFVLQLDDPSTGNSMGRPAPCRSPTSRPP